MVFIGILAVMRLPILVFLAIRSIDVEQWVNDAGVFGDGPPCSAPILAHSIKSIKYLCMNGRHIVVPIQSQHERRPLISL